MLHFLNTRFEELLGSFLLAVMACIAFINIIIRYCTNLSFSASEELTVNFFVWIVLLGTSIAFRESSNFTMNLLYSITHGWSAQNALLLRRNLLTGFLRHAGLLRCD